MFTFCRNISESSAPLKLILAQAQPEKYHCVLPATMQYLPKRNNNQAIPLHHRGDTNNKNNRIVVPIHPKEDIHSSGSRIWSREGRTFLLGIATIKQRQSVNGANVYWSGFRAHLRKALAFLSVKYAFSHLYHDNQDSLQHDCYHPQHY